MYSMSGCQTTWNVPRHAGGVEALRGINAHRLAADKRRRRRQQKTNDARHLHQHMNNSRLSHSHTLFVLTKISTYMHVRVHCTSYRRHLPLPLCLDAWREHAVCWRRTCLARRSSPLPCSRRLYCPERARHRRKQSHITDNR